MKKLVILSSLAALALCLNPQPSLAVWGAGDVSLDPANLGVSSSQLSQAGLQTVSQYMGVLKTYGLDQVAYQVAQKLSQKLVASVLNAVNGGASQNKPQNFITNFPNYFQSIAGQATSTYLNKINTTNNPFLRSVSTNISNQSAYGGSSDLSQFNLDKILTNGASWQSAAGDLRNAGNQGWDFYNQLALPGNTPIGSTIAAKEELSRQIAYQNEIAKIQLTSPGYKPQTDNKGFGLDLLSSFTNINSGQLVNASTSLAHQGIQNGQFNSAFNQSQNSGSTYQEDALGNLGNGQVAPDHFSGSSLASMNVPGSDPEDAVPQTEDYSASKDVGATIQSPTSTNESNVNNATQESVKRLQGADEFFKLIFSTLTQLTTSLIQKGISSLKSDSGSKSNYQYGSPSDATKALAGTNGQGGSWLASPEQIIDFRNELGVANQKTALDVKLIQEQIDLIKHPVTGKTLTSRQIAANEPESNGTMGVLEKLEACIPGPDTGWEDRLAQYVEDQIKPTINRGSQDGDKGEANSQAEKLVERMTQTAVQEEKERVENPLLNIPGARELRSEVALYYPNAKKFQATFTLLLAKRQTAAQLANIVAQVKALRPDLVLFDDQWEVLSNAQKSALYDSIKDKLATSLPGADYLEINNKGDSIPKILPVGDAHYDEMKRRVLDEQWNDWETDETKITSGAKQNLYRQFVAVKQNITDSKSLQDSQNKRDSLKQQNTDLADALHDCLAIRDAAAHYDQYDDAKWDDFKKTLYLESIRSGFVPNASIVAIAKGLTDYPIAKEGDITLPIETEQLPKNGDGNYRAYVVRSNPIQVPSGLPGAGQINSSVNPISFTNIGLAALAGMLPKDNNPFVTPYVRWVDQGNINELQVQPVVPFTTLPDGRKIGVPLNLVTQLYDQDANGALYCRLPNYLLNYWIPDDPSLTGSPIACFSANVASYDSTHGINHLKATKANWYKTNRAEIYYTISDANF